MARIVLEHVSKQFPGGAVAVDDVSLTVEDGEFMVLVGPSGCGKTTILRMVAGLEEVTAGELYIGERVMTDASPKDRDVAMVFQNYALYPHMTVEQNIGFGLKLRHTPREERQRRVLEVARVLALEPYLKRKPAELSGGQRQRVAMGRAIVREPKAYLMDEPLSNLDAKLRVQMRAELARIHQRLRTTTVYVTHDQVEAMTLGDRVAVMRDGVLQQVANPSELFTRPANVFVAAFIGSPSMNLIEATIREGSVEFGRHRLPLPSWFRGAPGTGVILGIRPSDFDDADLPGGAGRPTLEVIADVIEELGSEINVLFRLDAKAAVTEATLAAASEEGGGGTAPLDALTGAETSFTARVDPRTRIRRGGTLRLAVDPERFHFFDPASGAALRAQREPAPAVAP